jgi:hypothetical protein
MGSFDALRRKNRGAYKSLKELEAAFEDKYVPPPECYAWESNAKMVKCGNHRIRARRAFIDSGGEVTPMVLGSWEDPYRYANGIRPQDWRQYEDQEWGDEASRDGEYTQEETARDWRQLRADEAAGEWRHGFSVDTDQDWRRGAIQGGYQPPSRDPPGTAQYEASPTSERYRRSDPREDAAYDRTPASQRDPRTGSWPQVPPPAGEDRGGEWYQETREPAPEDGRGEWRQVPLEGWGQDSRQPEAPGWRQESRLAPRRDWQQDSGREAETDWRGDWLRAPGPDPRRHWVDEL